MLQGSYVHLDLPCLSCRVSKIDFWTPLTPIRQSGHLCSRHQHFLKLRPQVVEYPVFLVPALPQLGLARLISTDCLCIAISQNACNCTNPMCRSLTFAYLCLRDFALEAWLQSSCLSSEAPGLLVLRCLHLPQLGWWEFQILPSCHISAADPCQIIKTYSASEVSGSFLFAAELGIVVGGKSQQYARLCCCSSRIREQHPFLCGKFELSDPTCISHNIGLA